MSDPKNHHEFDHEDHHSGPLPGDLAVLRRLDPVDQDRVADLWDAGPAAEALLASILSAPLDRKVVVTDLMAGRRRVATGDGGRRRMNRWIAGAAAAVIMAVVIGVAPWGSSPAYAIRRLSDGVIEVDWAEDLRDGDSMARELRAFGIDVDVVVAPASPSLVGEVVSTALPGQDPGPVEGITWGDDGTDDVFRWRIDPAVFTGPLRIELGVEAEPGDVYTVANEVFEPGEILGGLHCALDEPLRADAIVPYLEQLGLTPLWDVVRAVPGRTDSYMEDRVSTVPDGRVLWGYAVDSETVRFSIAPDGIDLSRVDGLEPRLSDVPCTPEMAEGW